MKNGGKAQLDGHGKVREMHANGMDIRRGPDGRSRIVRENPDHSRVFAERGGRGYVQHPYRYGGREFGRRTYYVNGRAYDRFYGRYEYNHVALDVYAPQVYFAPAFYGWAYNPWAAPVPYAWGWAGNPGALYYGAYFTPYPVYPNASLWLTDYMISTNLQAAYQAQVEAAGGAAPAPFAAPVPLTPEVKALVAAEVQLALARENAEQAQAARNVAPDPFASSIARLLSDNAPHVFVVGGPLGVTDASGQECSLSEGDILQLAGPPAPGATAASAAVLGSKGQDCRRGDSISVGLADLQDMQNHMRETVDQGLAEVQTRGGLGGSATLPVQAKAPPVAAPYAAAAPPPDPNVAAQINQQVADAERLEKEAVSAGGPSDPGTPAPLTPPVPQGPPPVLKLGLTFDEVISIQGQPKNIIDLGAKKTYNYPDMKIVFTNGKVTDIQ
jgi:hypothetical protein